jgi:hypothetical protein
MVNIYKKQRSRIRLKSKSSRGITKGCISRRWQTVKSKEKEGSSDYFIVWKWYQKVL